MYKLPKPIHWGLGVLIQEVEGHIKQTGLEAVKSLKGDNVSSFSFHLQCVSKQWIQHNYIIRTIHVIFESNGFNIIVQEIEMERERGRERDRERERR